MAALTITSRGQITLRKELLNHLGLKPGETIEVDKLPDGKLSLSAKRRTGTIQDFIGCLAGESDVVLTIDEMNEIIAKGWAGQL
jgi:AbrB family looped-hinge helix DNA binding protein